MGRELIERACLGPRASVSAAVARTGPQAGASWRANRPYQKTEAELPKAARGETEPTGRASTLLSYLIDINRGGTPVHVAACEPHWATAIYAPATHQERRGDFATRGKGRAPSASKENATPQSSPQRRAGERNVPIVFITPSEGPRAVQSRLASDGTLASMYICTTVRIRGRRHRRLE